MALTKKDLSEALRKTQSSLLEAMRSHGQQINARVDRLEKKTGVRFDQFDTKLNQLDQKFDMKIDQLDKKIDKKVDEGIHSLKVLIEDVRADIKFGFEIREPHEEKINQQGKPTSLKAFHCLPARGWLITAKAKKAL